MTDPDTSTCRVCGADLSEKPDARVTITPAGGFCSFHVKDVA
jgi:hypothetical protein